MVEHVDDSPIPHAQSESWMIGQLLDVGGTEGIARQLIQPTSNAKRLIAWHSDQRLDRVAAELEGPHRPILTVGRFHVNLELIKKAMETGSCGRWE